MSGESDNLSALVAQANALTATVNRLNEDVGEQVVELARVNKLNRHLIKILIATVTGLIILGVLITIGLFSIKANADKIEDIRTTEKQEALCPLYDLFLDSKSEAAKQRYPQGPEAYERAFDIIEHGYDALHCERFAEEGSQRGN